MLQPKTVKKFVLSTYPTEFEIPSIQVKSSHDINCVMRRIYELDGNDIQEFFYVVFLNRANIITGYYLASMGGMTGTVADPRLIIKSAAMADCVSIVLCHNHPSGQIKPSRADEELTKKIKQAATYFDIRLLDHLIINDSGDYYSFADEGII